jgi:hypothetical protein
MMVGVPGGAPPAHPGRFDVPVPVVDRVSPVAFAEPVPVADPPASMPDPVVPSDGDGFGSVGAVSLGIRLVLLPVPAVPAFDGVVIDCPGVGTGDGPVPLTAPPVPPLVPVVPAPVPPLLPAAPPAAPPPPAPPPPPDPPDWANARLADRQMAPAKIKVRMDVSESTSTWGSTLFQVVAAESRSHWSGSCPQQRRLDR